MTARWALVLGSKGSGKSSALDAIATGLRASRVRVAGVIQDAVTVDGQRCGYRARRVTTGEWLTIASTSPGDIPAAEAFCGFHFAPGAFANVRAWLAQDGSDAEVVLIDEVSKLEAAGQGHHAAVVDLLEGAALVVLAVRADQLFYVVERFGLGDPVASYEVGAPTEAFVADLLAEVRR